jgi:hypothetical protein
MNETKKILYKYIMTIKNSFFIASGGGMGDFFFYCIVCILVCDRYENVYIYYDKVHFNSMVIYLNKFINCNNKKNIILLNNLSNNEYLEHFKIMDNFYGSRELNIFNTNTYFSDYCDLNKFNQECLYINLLNILNLKVNDLFTIKYYLNDEEINQNNIYYEHLVNKIGYDYIVIFNQPVHRYHDIFTIRNYENEFNKNKYKVIYFSEQFTNDKITIQNILGEYKPLYLYHKIIEKAKSIHCIDSFPSQYFNIELNNIYNKDKYSNLDKNIYSRKLTGVNLNHNSYIVNSFKDYKDSISRLYNNFTAYYPLYFFRFYDYPTKYYNDNGCSILACSGNRNIINDNIFIEHTNDLDKRYLKFFNKILQQNIVCNKLGIFYNENKSKYNFIDIKLNEQTINNDYIENLNNLSHSENHTIINKYLNIQYINILLIKFNSIYYIQSNPRILNDNNEIIYNEIITPSEESLNLVTHSVNNQYVDYIFPYRNDEDKSNFIKLFQQSSHS